MLRNVIGTAGLIVWTIASAQSIQAGTILQEQISTYQQIYANAPIGQTFTAEDEHISRVAFYFDDFNNQLLNGSTIVRLYEGDAIAGDPIYVDGEVITPGTQGLYFFNILPVPLTIGETYTIELERFNARWGVGVNQVQFSSGDPIPGRVDYTGGHAIINGQPAPRYDLAFRVIPEVVGDANIDGLVDGRDYLIWAAHYGDDPADIPPGPPENGDLNADGHVDGLDYLFWVTAFSEHNATAVPEPSTVSLAMVSLTLLAWRRTAQGRRLSRQKTRPC